jgi:hypothetical protein
MSNANILFADRPARTVVRRRSRGEGQHHGPTVMAVPTESPGDDLETRIAAAEADATRLRGAMPAAIDDVCRQAGAWASDQWDELIRSEIKAHPDRARLHQSALPALKEALRELQGRAEGVARTSVAEAFIDATNDDKLADLVQEQRFDDTIRVSLGNRRWEDPHRRLLGSIGPAMAQAGLLDVHSAVDPNGRFKDGLPTPPPEVARSENVYDELLRSLCAAVYQARRLRRKNAQHQAENLWDEA